MAAWLLDDLFLVGRYRPCAHDENPKWLRAIWRLSRRLKR